MFVPDKWQSNPYRVLRLSAGATASDVHTAAAAMRRLTLLGAAEIAPLDVPELGTISRTDADIRAAVGRLANPVQRLADRLFWFHSPISAQEAPSTETKERSDVDLRGAVVKRHDESLKGLYASLNAGTAAVGAGVWSRALRAWAETIADDEYWALSLAIEEDGAFEPSVLPSEIDSLREEAPALAAEPLIVAARDAVARDDAPTAVRIVTVLNGLADTGLWVSTALYDIASLSADRLRTLCRAVHDQLKSAVVREQDAGAQNKKPCEAALKRFRTEVQPALTRVLQLIPEDHELAQQSREEVAVCLSEIATDYTWADDFIISEELREEALKLARDTLGAIRIEDGLAQIRQAARHQRVYGTPITSAPSLSTYNGIGFTLCGHSDFDPETQSYSTTHYFVALFLPVFPIARYRVINFGSQYRFLGKLPLRKADRWHIGISLTAILALILGGAMSSSTQTVSPSYSGSGTSSNYVDKSTASQSDLASLKTQIQGGRSRMKVLQATLQPVVEEVKGLDEQLDGLKTDLKNLDRQQKAGEQIDTTEYNAKVERHNTILRRRRALVEANQATIQEYDELEKQDAEMVKKYNALLGVSK